MDKKIRSKIIAILVTIFMILVLFSQVNIKDILYIIITIKPEYLIIGFLVYSLSYVFRAVRFYFLLNREVGVRDLFRIMCIHNLINSILPMRTGELSYIYLLKKHHDRSTEEGAATLIEARIFDMIAVSMLFFLSAAISRQLPTPIIGAMWAIALLAAFLLALMVLMPKSNIFVGALRTAAVIMNLDKKPLFYLLVEKMDNIAKIFACMNWDKFFWCILISVGCWISSYSVMYILVAAMGIDFPFGTVLLASTFSLLTTILPIQGLGGFGTIEGGWTIGFMLFGISRELAISSGFSMHIIIILYYLILGAIGFVYRR